MYIFAGKETNEEIKGNLFILLGLRNQSRRNEIAVFILLRNETENEEMKVIKYELRFIT